MFQKWLQITLESILLLKTASEVSCEKRPIFLTVHIGQRAIGGPIARCATAQYCYYFFFLEHFWLTG